MNTLAKNNYHYLLPKFKNACGKRQHCRPCCGFNDRYFDYCDLTFPWEEVNVQLGTCKFFIAKEESTLTK
ncbi:hypothetical protein M0R19_05365 [Candidatus Pacearchaeota archaeon]|jgi:hypothetical protein|nr:hypothetical protein [Candidatus Pacearchaeota archaeon]